jgi:hypothetical protein
MTFFISAARRFRQGAGGLAARPWVSHEENWMVRTFVALAVSVLLGAGAALAQDAKGKGSGTRARGTVKKFDAATGTLTVSIKGRQDAEAKDQEFKVSDATKVTVYGDKGGDKKEMTGKDGFKSLKEGTRVVVVHAEGKVTEVVVNPPMRTGGGDK